MLPLLLRIVIRNALVQDWGSRAVAVLRDIAVKIVRHGACSRVLNTAINRHIMPRSDIMVAGMLLLAIPEIVALNYYLE